jgi:hypothetical protein
LKELRPKPTPTPFIGTSAPPKTNPTIYLHYRGQNDVATLKKIAAAIRKQTNYVVPGGFQLVAQPTTGDVRYFHKEDEAKATQVKEIVENTLRAGLIDKTLELKPSLRLGAAKGVPRGWIEVWLPTLPQPTYRPARRNNPARVGAEQQQKYNPPSKN